MLKWTLAVLMMVAAMPVQAAWLEARTPGFLVYSDGSEAQLRKFADKLERLDFAMRVMTNAPAERPPVVLRVFVTSRSAVRQLYGSGTAKDVMGFYSTSFRGPVAFVSRASGSSDYSIDGEAILYHEYSHHFMRQHSRFPYPLWYSEGFAEYFASAEFLSDGTTKIGLPIPLE
jgi:hypothetical protein